MSRACWTHAHSALLDPLTFLTGQVRKMCKVQPTRQQMHLRNAEHESTCAVQFSGQDVQVAYNQAMASCSWEQAWACFHAMRRAGVQPNTRSYNAVSHPPELGPHHYTLLPR